MIAAAAVLLLAAPMLARAQDDEKTGGGRTLHGACHEDVQRLCAGVQPGGGRILACMREHAADLSQTCREAIDKARAAREAQQGK
jgi:hypothetical protein